MVASPRTTQHKKRHGKHQKHTKSFLDVYWPYVPLLLIVTTGLVFSSYWQPRSRHGVLAYATSVGISDLLDATNQQRAANSIAALAINSQLNQAAQAKANDMVTRNYWSHNTPEGNPPWVFIDAAGYSYKKAGENLAYGFMTSDDTITGWMNSPAHKENLLNAGYTDVGFGFANSSDYQNTGPETIVVAMYGAPLHATAPAPVAAAPPAVVKSAAVTPKAPDPVIAAAPIAAPTTSPTPPPAGDKAAPPVTTDTKVIVEPIPQKVSRLSALTHGAVPWLTSFAALTAIFSGVVLMIKHSWALHKWLVRGERYVLHHTLFDVTIISLIGLCMIVSQTAGVIR